jgi:hypothetical protein
VFYERRFPTQPSVSRASRSRSGFGRHPLGAMQPGQDTWAGPERTFATLLYELAVSIDNVQGARTLDTVIAKLLYVDGSEKLHRGCCGPARIAVRRMNTGVTLGRTRG